VTFSPVVGYLSDRASSRRLHYLIGLLALIISTFLVAVARIYWILVLARVLQGASSAIVWTVGMAVLADTMPTEQLGMAMGIIGSVVSLAMVSSPVLGGTVYHKFGYEAVFWVLGGMLLIDVILRLMMIERRDAEQWGIDSGSSETQAEDSAPLLNNSVEVKSTSLVKLLFVHKTHSWLC
jgi:MFS family permease